MISQYAAFMQGREVEREARERLPALLASLLGVDDVSIEVETSNRDGVVEAAGRVWMIEVKSSSGPGSVVGAADQLEHFAAHVGRDVVPVLVVPYMSSAGARTAAERGLNWVDLSGNALIRDGELFVHVQGRPNQYSQRGRPASAFAPKSSRIARTLLLDPWRWWRQTRRKEINIFFWFLGFNLLV